MENLKNPATMGKIIYQILEKNKILLLQDKVFPNIVAEIVGVPIKGSWWGHPLANPIYNGLGWLDHNRQVLAIKLVDGKVTYIHESLFADVYSIVSKPRDWQTKKLSEKQMKLFKHISKNGKATLGEKKDLLILEKKLLVFSREVHTDSGRHIKIYQPWKKSKISTKNIPDYKFAIENIEKIIADHNRKSGAKAKLPW